MIYPAADKLDAMPSKYALVIVAAKRSRQLKEGARRMMESRSTNPLTVALEEIGDGAIVPLHVGEPERLPESVPPIPVLTGLVSTSVDDDEPIHEPTAAEISALLAPTEDMAAYEPDAELDDDILQSDTDVLEAEIDDAAEEGPYGVPVPDASLGAGDDSTAQHLEDVMMDDADNDTE